VLLTDDLFVPISICSVGQ